MSGRGLGTGKFYIFPILVVFLFVTSYQEAYGITYQFTIGETGVPSIANDHFNALIGVAVDSSGNIYVADEDSHRVQKFNSARVYQFTIGQSGVAGSDSSHLRFPAGVAVNSTGNIFVSDTDNHRVVVFDSSGNYLSQIGCAGTDACAAGSANGQFNFPAGIAIDNSDNIYVVDSLNHRVQKFDSNGAYLSKIDISSIPDEEQSGIAVDSSGNIYVADTNNQRVEKFDSIGGLVKTIGEPGVPGCDSTHLNLPAGVAVDSSGNIYVVDSSNQRVQIFDFTGKYMSTLGESGVSGTSGTQFNFPFGVAVDTAGNIIVGDSFNFRVQIFATLDGLGTLGSDTCPSSIHSGGDPLPSMIKPSFGGVGNMVFADGLTLDGQVYDLSKFAQNIPKTIADVGQPVKIKIKEQLNYGPQDWKYVAVYMNFEGKDPETYNAHLIMSLDKNEGQKIVDPKGYIKDYSVTTDLDSKYVYTTFSFTAAKAMPDSTMIVTAWDGHSRTNNVHVGGAIQFGPDDIIVQNDLPAGVIKFTDYYSLKERIGSDGYYSPKILAHIHGTSNVLPDGDSVNVFWLYNSNTHELTLVVSDKDGNRFIEQTQKLEKIVYSHIGYCDLPGFQGSCTSTPVYVDTPEGKALHEKYQGKYADLLKSMGFVTPHY